jgi:hypothetical protein
MNNGYPPANPFHGALDEIQAQAQPTIRVSCHASPTFREFDRAHIQLLIKLIDIRWNCVFTESQSVAEQMGLLRSAENRYHVAVGLINSLSRQANGLRFIPYGGLITSIAAVALSSQSEVNWGRIIRASPDILAITVKGELGDTYLRAALGYDEAFGNIQTTTLTTTHDISDMFIATVQRYPHKQVVFCASDYRCYLLIRDGGLKGQPFIIPTRQGEADDSPPVFQDGMLVPKEDGAFAELLEAAVQESYVNAPNRLAGIYAKLFSRLIPPDQPTGHHFPFARLYSSPYMTPGFVREVQSRLMAELDNRNFPRDQHDDIAFYVVEDALRSVDRSHLAGQLAALSARLDSIVD